MAQTVTIDEQKVCPESESKSLKFSTTPTPQVKNPSDSDSTALVMTTKQTAGCAFDIWSFRAILPGVETDAKPPCFGSPRRHSGSRIKTFPKSLFKVELIFLVIKRFEQNTFFLLFTEWCAILGLSSINNTASRNYIRNCNELMVTLRCMGVRRNISRKGGISLILVRLLTMQCKYTFKKRLSISARLHHKQNATITATKMRFVGSNSLVYSITMIFKAELAYFFSQKYCHGLWPLTKPQVPKL